MCISGRLTGVNRKLSRHVIYRICGVLHQKASTEAVYMRSIMDVDRPDMAGWPEIWQLNVVRCGS